MAQMTAKSNPKPFVSRRPARRPGTTLPTVGFGLCLVIAVGIGYLAGSGSSEPARRKPPAAVASNAVSTKRSEILPPSPAPPEPRSTPAPAPSPKPELPRPSTTPTKKAEAKKPEPKKPESKPPEPKKPEPKKPAEAATLAVTFVGKVLPVLKDNCVICHGGAFTRGGLDLRTLAALGKGGDNGLAVKPGDPDNSPLWTSITDGSMPPAGKPRLSDAEKKTIRDWIAGGTK